MPTRHPSHDSKRNAVAAGERGRENVKDLDAARLSSLQRVRFRRGGATCPPQSYGRQMALAVGREVRRQTCGELPVASTNWISRRFSPIRHHHIGLADC
jgi:hypothetical protein